MDISCAFVCGPETPEHIALAERLGYRRAWCYDSPALCADVWMTLARAAERTGRIGLGPGVLVPSLRHVMTNAAAVATLSGLAPARVAVAVGAGFTGRMMLGRRSMKWRDVAAYIRALRGLLRGIDRGITTGELLARFGLVLEPDAFRARLARLEQEGVTEVAYQPAGPDIERELTAFARMAELQAT